MSAWWSGTVAELHASDPRDIVGRLATHLVRAHPINQPQQERAWRRDITLLADTLRHAPATWRLLLEYPMLRLERRIDAVLLTDRAILVLEFKGEASTTTDQRQVEDYALDLYDFHTASRQHPIVPILVSTTPKPPVFNWPLLWHAVAPVIVTNNANLANTIQSVLASIPAPKAPLPIAVWEGAPYRPVPGIIDAACLLYARNAVADIKTARADATNLSATTQTVLNAIHTARNTRNHVIIFVTGIPGAGKTLCGLNIVFGEREADATFLTGNPTLVHVLRGALARDAAGADRRALPAARRKTKTLIQALPTFRDSYVQEPTHIPPEHVAVIDEAQRAWSASHAIRKSRDRPVALDDSEPAIILDIMARHPDWSVIVCLIGGGQEIHDGEGGLEEWGKALANRPQWRVIAAPDALSATPARQFLPTHPNTEIRAELHLTVPIRHIHGHGAADWVNAVVQGDQSRAARIAVQHPVPFSVTRSLDVMRDHLRTHCLGFRRAGLLASSGAVRLRADGIGAQLPHMDAAAVEHWFLDRWPADIRASDALELLATEFSCQGLELDYVGLCWGGDLIRPTIHQRPWQARNFSGTRWQQIKDAQRYDNRSNTYRVLLTRARYETVIWVPSGDKIDTTRQPAEFDAVADFLLGCGAQNLDGDAPRISTPIMEATLL